jgi:ribose transport system permease protein
MPRDGFAAPASREPRPGRQTGLVLLRAGSLLAFAAVFGFFAIAAPGFLTVSNLANVVSQVAVVGVLALGLTVVIAGGGGNVVTGGIDLSLANVLGLSAAVFAALNQAGFGDEVAVPATLATGAAAGALNGFAVVVLGVLPLLATLAVMNICAGLELVLTHNTVVAASSPLLDALDGSFPAGVPVLADALLIVAVVLLVILHGTPLGLRIYAVGGHREAARAAGLPVRRIVAGTYVASGLCAAIAALLSAALLSGSSTGSGDMLLSIVVTALLGVVFSRRLVATVPGTVLSALFIGCLVNGFQLLNVSSYWVNGIQGVLILLVVAATSTLRPGRGA